MKSRKFLAVVMVCIMMVFAVSAEASLKIPKISKSTKKGVGNLMNKVVDKGSDAYTEHEKTKQEQAKAQRKPNTTIINNTTNNTVNNTNNVNINQTQINQTQNIGTNGGYSGNARMRVGPDGASISREQNNYPYQSQQQPQQRPTSSVPQTSSSTDPAGELRVSMKNFGSRLIANNSPAYEIQLSRNELPARVKTRFNRVVANSKTVVAGDAGSNKQYGAFCMVTSDPSYTFAGGIRVGAPVSTVENFFGKSISQLSSQPGRAHVKAGNVEIDILYNNNRITQVGYYDSNSLSCQRTGNYLNQKVSEIGLRRMY